MKRNNGCSLAMMETTDGDEVVKLVWKLEELQTQRDKMVNTMIVTGIDKNVIDMASSSIVDRFEDIKAELINKINSLSIQ